MGQPDKATLNIYTKLAAIQAELNAPKGQYNEHGNFKYRSAEDILEAAKPLLAKYNLLLTTTDDIVMVGDRTYVKPTALLRDLDNIEKTLKFPGFAREEEERKGMSAAQLTGATSSYARKYTYNGLFAIDDGVDADSLPPAQNTTKKATKAEPRTSGIYILTFGAHKDKPITEVPEKYLSEYLAVKASDPKVKKIAKDELARRQAIKDQDPDAPDKGKIKFATNVELQAILNSATQLYGEATVKAKLRDLLKKNLNITKSADIPADQVQSILQLIQTEIASKRSRESRTNQDIISSMISHLENTAGLLQVEAVSRLNMLTKEIANKPTIDSLDIHKDGNAIQKIKDRIGYNE